MSSSQHRAGMQILMFGLIALLPLVFALWLLLAEELGFWPGFWLVAATAAPLVVGLLLLASIFRKFETSRRDRGNQNRGLQEAHLEHERLEHERRSIAQKFRQISEQQTNQNHAVLELAKEFVRIAGEVKDTAEAAKVSPEATRKLAFLNTMAQDLVSLVTVEVQKPELFIEDFVVDQEIRALAETLKEQDELPSTFRVLGDDADISARTDRVLFIAAMRAALVTLRPFAISGEMTLEIISYVHADIGPVAQLKICTRGFGINDLDSSEWFSHFQLHKDKQGRYLGPGLGMMMVKRYCDRLGGRVAVSAELQDQVCVTLTLPLRDENDPDE